jgi:pilus assembly protein Flp/PilA
MSGHRQWGRFPKEGIHMLNHAFLSVLTRAQAQMASRVRREEGQALVEYALILFLIAVVCIAVLTTLGTSVKNTLQSIADAM